MSQTRAFLPLKGALALAFGAVVAACGEVASPTSPDIVASFETVGEIAQEVTLCKIGPADSWAEFSITADGGVLQQGSSVRIDAATSVDQIPGTGCVVIWKPTDPKLDPDPTVTITVTETAMTFGTFIEQISVFGGGLGYTIGQNSVTLQANFNNGAVIAFKNAGIPFEGGEGCTPGYWRQEQHFGNWTAPYTPSTPFSAVFDNAFPGQTLLDVVWLGGGGLNALGRHTVAALLNAASPDVNYGMTPQEVIDAFNATYPGNKQAYETQKDIFEARNEFGCALGRAE